MQFGQVRRVTLHEDGEPESDTTHTVMLAMLAMELAPQIGLDPGLAAQFAIVHDLPETYAGDTNTARGLTPEEAANKARREAAAMKVLADDLNGTRSLNLLLRYEAQREHEARLVRYLDKVLPKLTHYLNRGAALEVMGLTVDDVRQKHALQGSQLAEQYPEMTAVRALYDAACRAVEQAITSDYLTVACKPAVQAED